MTLTEIIDTAEGVGRADERRREAFEEELAAYESGDLDSFPETRAAIAEEREKLDDLSGLLADERGEIEHIVDYTDFMTADQAVEHRDEAVSKLEAHNRHLETFVESMRAALDVVERNLSLLESVGPEAIEESPEADLKRAREALEAHNEAVEGLGTNMTILNAYVI